ncbi:hypothetical protein ACLMJK_003757 [Lecanora helva]
MSADTAWMDTFPSSVAVSHVWLDGKGNPNRNFLPICQLRLLQDRVNTLFPSERHPVPFWMDSLCVPVGRKYWPVRNIVLNRLKSTFKSADRIIVFDSSFEIIGEEVAPEEALIRIRYLPWSSRLWTMQEGRLSRKVYFQFKDKGIPFDDHPYQGGVHGNLQAIKQVLKQLTDQDITYSHIHNHERQAQSLTALLLVRALAFTDKKMELRRSYAQKPPQDDPMEEDLRLSAIESFQDLQLEDDLHKTWYPIAKRLIGETYEPSRRDDKVRSSIHATIMNPIVSDCSEA